MSQKVHFLVSCEYEETEKADMRRGGKRQVPCCCQGAASKRPLDQADGRVGLLRFALRTTTKLAATLTTGLAGPPLAHHDALAPAVSSAFVLPSYSSTGSP